MTGPEREDCVLIFAPFGRDAAASAGLLRDAGLATVICADLTALISEIEAGAGVVFLAEEGLFGKDMAPITLWVERQPAWSDLPFIVLTSHQEQPAVLAWRRTLASNFRNVSFLERPVQQITLTSAVQSAIRARRRQHEVREFIRGREHAAEELEKVVVERTRALAEANEQLRLEIAERTRIEETLRQAQKLEAIGRLTGGIAHDFNNILMVLSGGLEMLDRLTDPPKRQRLMEGMLHAARRGAGLTRQLLSFSRRQQLTPTVLNIAQQIGGMRDLLDRSLRGDLHVEVDFPDALWPVEADPGELELVVLNLAVNARDAMPNGGTIIVRGENLPNMRDAELAGDYVCLSVIDSGTGMTPEVLAHVFEPYFTTKDSGRGSGLGLAQVYGFAKQSQGSVRIESEPAQGTRVALYLPRSQKVPSSDHHHRVGLTADRQRVRVDGHVLVVEDDDEVAALVSEMLDHLGYEVIRVANATAALGVLSNGRHVDVVFSDIMMPGNMNGIDLAREIRKRRADLPVLLTSAYAKATDDRVDAGDVPILQKPYSIDELSAALHEATSKRAQLSPGAY
jgi:signal transduction histidine kinase/ActR/RegA family two-component response regulator